MLYQSRDGEKIQHVSRPCYSNSPFPNFQIEIKVDSAQKYSLWSSTFLI